MTDPVIPWYAAEAAVILVPAILLYGRHHAPRIRQQARNAMRERAMHDGEARITLWNGRGNGGIGVIQYPRGSVQAHYEKGVYRIEWIGRKDHPAGMESFRTTDRKEFLARLAMWTSRGHVHRRDHFRAGPMMAI